MMTSESGAVAGWLAAPWLEDAWLAWRGALERGKGKGWGGGGGGALARALGGMGGAGGREWGVVGAMLVSGASATGVPPPRAALFSEADQVERMPGRPAALPAAASWELVMTSAASPASGGPWAPTGEGELMVRPEGL